MNEDALKESIRRELPGWLRDDPEMRSFVLELTRVEYANRSETGDRFYELLAELRRDREKQERKWDEQNRKWDESQAQLERDREEQARKWDEQNQEQARKWDEQNQEQARKWDEQNRKWDEQNRKWYEAHAQLERDREEQARKWDEQNQEQARKWDEQNRKWEEQNRKWDESQARLERDREEQERKWEEQNRKWDESRREFQQVHEEIMAQAKKLDRSIGALGARWGMQSERAFRDALAGILEESFGVEVLHVNEYDDSGEVFGRPDQVELDVIIRNGLLIICELKSSIDKPGMYSFERKARFYERRHGRTADRLIVISPMIDARAQKVARELGIETYSDSIDVETEI